MTLFDNERNAAAKNAADKAIEDFNKGLANKTPAEVGEALAAHSEAMAARQSRDHSNTRLMVVAVGVVMVLVGIFFWTQRPDMLMRGSVDDLNAEMQSGFAAAQMDRDAKHTEVVGKLNLLGQQVSALAEGQQAIRGELVTMQGMCRLDKPCEQSEAVTTAVTNRCWLGDGSVRTVGRGNIIGLWKGRNAPAAKSVDGVMMYACLVRAPASAQASYHQYNGGGSAECGAGKVFQNTSFNLKHPRKVAGGWCGYPEQDDDDQSNGPVDPGTPPTNNPPSNGAGPVNPGTPVNSGAAPANNNGGGPAAPGT